MWTFASNGQEWLVKDLRATHPLYRFTWGRFVLRWEEGVYRTLEGLDRIPAFPGRLDADALVLEKLDAVPMDRGLIPNLPPTFFADLALWIDRLHARGVVHLDLRQKRNVMIGADGKPFVVDFGGAMRLGTSWFSRKLLLPVFSWIDRSAIVKYRVRYFPDLATEEEKKRDRRMNLMRRLWVFSPHKPRKTPPTRKP